MRRFIAIVALILVSAVSSADDRTLVLNQDYAPLKKDPPIYPNISQYEGLAGWCIVEYVVTASGSVEDPFPESCNPIGLFEGASLSAAKDFRYQPRITDGVAVDVAGVQNKFTFVLGSKVSAMAQSQKKQPLEAPQTYRFSLIKKRHVARLDKFIDKKDWSGLKDYAVDLSPNNFRLLYFAGYADLMMGNKSSAYDFIEQFIFHEGAAPPFEYVTFNALQLLVMHYYNTQDYEKLLTLDQHVDVWAFRLIDKKAVNRMVLMIADAYGIQGNVSTSNKKFKQIVDRARLNSGEEDPFVEIAQSALVQ
jgi:hypothetical protein